MDIETIKAAFEVREALSDKTSELRATYSQRLAARGKEIPEDFWDIVEIDAVSRYAAELLSLKRVGLLNGFEKYLDYPKNYAAAVESGLQYYLIGFSVNLPPY